MNRSEHKIVAVVGTGVCYKSTDLMGSLFSKRTFERLVTVKRTEGYFVDIKLAKPKLEPIVVFDSDEILPPHTSVRRQSASSTPATSGLLAKTFATSPDNPSRSERLWRHLENEFWQVRYALIHRGNRLQKGNVATRLLSTTSSTSSWGPVGLPRLDCERTTNQQSDNDVLFRPFSGTTSRCVMPQWEVMMLGVKDHVEIWDKSGRSTLLDRVLLNQVVVVRCNASFATDFISNSRCRNSTSTNSIWTNCSLLDGGIALADFLRSQLLKAIDRVGFLLGSLLTVAGTASQAVREEANDAVGCLIPDDMTGTSVYINAKEDFLEYSHCVDGRTDIWSLGVVLYQLLTGRIQAVCDRVPSPFSRNRLIASTGSLLKRTDRDLDVNLKVESRLSFTGEQVDTVRHVCSILGLQRPSVAEVGRLVDRSSQLTQWATWRPCGKGYQPSPKPHQPLTVLDQLIVDMVQDDALNVRGPSTAQFGDSFVVDEIDRIIRAGVEQSRRISDDYEAAVADVSYLQQGHVSVMERDASSSALQSPKTEPLNEVRQLIAQGLSVLSTFIDRISFSTAAEAKRQSNISADQPATMLSRHHVRGLPRFVGRVYRWIAETSEAIGGLAGLRSVRAGLSKLHSCCSTGNDAFVILSLLRGYDFGGNRDDIIDGLHSLGGLNRASHWAWRKLKNARLRNIIERRADSQKNATSWSDESKCLEWAVMHAASYGVVVEFDHRSSVPACLITIKARSILFVFDGLSDAEKSWAICHEVAHKLLKHGPTSIYADENASNIDENQAEAVASLWCHFFGLSTVGVFAQKTSRSITKAASINGLSQSSRDSRGADRYANWLTRIATVFTFMILK